jgi:hypothetical protein
MTMNYKTTGRLGQEDGIAYSRPSIVFMSPSSISNSPTWPLAMILDLVTLFGSGTKPCSNFMLR